ncbi:MAG: oligosaccharide flippase family protein [Candidatus Cloacimonadaceae bacterium]|jgi:O-antigen/teichoic acid export membrane protein|nr:oligosaccharide flippase family protein [Candidatus Cloacimonadota bacterium]
MFKLAKNISIYTLGNILNRSITFILVPLYTRVLVPADYGKLELVNSIGAILAILYGLLIETGYSRMFFKYKDPEWRKSLYFSGQVFNIFCCIIVGLFTFIYANEIANKILNFPEGIIFLKLITIITLLKVLTNIPMYNIRNREKASLFISINGAYLLLNTLLSIYFLVFRKLGVSGILYAQILSGIMELVALYYFTWDQFSFRFSFEGLKKMLAFSIFLVPSNISSFILNYSNRYFLSAYMDLKEVGLYSLGAKLAAVIPFLFTEPVKMAFSPYIYNIIDDPQKCKQQVADFSRIFFVGLAIVATLISLFAKEAIAIIASTNYSGSHSIVFFLSFSYLFMGLAGIIVNCIHISLKTWIVTLVWIFSAVINIVLNVLLIPKYGRMGASIATMISSLLIVILYFVAVHFVYPVNFSYSKFIYLSILTVTINIIAQYVDRYFNYALIIKIFLFISYIILIIVSNYFSKEEKHKAISLTKTWVRKHLIKKGSY